MNIYKLSILFLLFLTIPEEKCFGQDDHGKWNRIIEKTRMDSIKSINSSLIDSLGQGYYSIKYFKNDKLLVDRYIITDCKTMKIKKNRNWVKQQEKVVDLLRKTELTSEQKQKIGLVCCKRNNIDI